MKTCIYCGVSLPDEALFCHACGKRQAKLYTQVFRRGKMKEEEFIQKINIWFATYPQVANVECRFETASYPGMLVDKYVLNALAIRYECLDGENRNQYALTHLQHFGLAAKKGEVLLQEWKNSNPGAIVVNYTGGLHQRGDSSMSLTGGLGASNKTQLYVFFKFNRRLGTGVPPQKE